MVPSWCCFIWNPAMWFLFAGDLHKNISFSFLDSRNITGSLIKDYCQENLWKNIVNLCQYKKSTSLSLDHFSVQLFFRRNSHILFCVVPTLAMHEITLLPENKTLQLIQLHAFVVQEIKNKKIGKNSITTSHTFQVIPTLYSIIKLHYT